MDITRTHYAANIKVVGLGSSGADAMSHISSLDIEGVDFILVRAHGAQSPAVYDREGKVGGGNAARILEVGNDSEVEPRAVKESSDELRSALKDADMIVLITGESDEPQIGVAPSIGKIAREMGALVAGIVTHPVESQRSHEYSARLEEGVQSLREAVDMLIMVPDDTLLPGFFAALRGR
jgi:cell division protein FtsZ